MKVVLKTDEYTVFQRRDGRYAVKGADRLPVNGDAKVAILVEHQLIDVAVPKPPAPEAVDEPAAEEAADASAEDQAPADEGPADEAASAEAAGEEESVADDDDRS